jgi:predicted flap endonuclease-1-like 5' DNA nuclease
VSAPTAKNAGQSAETKGQDDLTIVEGIGPAIAKLLNSQGISSFAQLAKTDEQTIQAILREAGHNFQIHSPATWARQAKLASEGKWEQLKTWQEELNAGREKATVSVGPSEADKAIASKPQKPDDLTKIEGIGPAIAELLNADGIYTFESLASAEQDRLIQILKDAGPRFRMHSPANWPAQSRLAADGKWDQLRELQDSLTAGREA